MTMFLHHLLGHLLPGATSSHLMFVRVAVPLPAVSPVGSKEHRAALQPMETTEGRGQWGSAIEIGRSPESHC